MKSFVLNHVAQEQENRREMLTIHWEGGKHDIINFNSKHPQSRCLLFNDFPNKIYKQFFIKNLIFLVLFLASEVWEEKINFLLESSSLWKARLPGGGRRIV